MTTNRPAAAPNVLVVGETIIDIVDRDGVTTEHVGGSPANVALTLARLGNPLRFVTDLADDERGACAHQHLAASNVLVEPRPVGQTSTAHARLQPDGSAEYTFNISFSSQRVELGAATHVHTGSIAAFHPPSAQAVRALLASLPAGVTSSLDPNIRRALIGSPAHARETFEALSGCCDIIKLSDEDADWLYPGELADAVLDRLLELGARLAVVTLGAKGMLLASAEARVGVPAARIKVADTIGAGDSAMGAIVDIALREGLQHLDEFTLMRIGTWAARVAGVTTSRAGANPPQRQDLVALK
ncbi:carbohydrate kinase [Cryobacterium sp. N19]|uniref:carbohydrate kinase family protein n=1 Tax=Cryobacterium sp. N19 TaxID=2048288 RepID=UPI000CE540E7|nr:carbohydrate kinase [Cryobacterium sp. N19]